MVPPIRCRELKAEIVRKDLTLRQVAKKAGVPYWTASEILRGKRVDPERFVKLERVIRAAAMPLEVAA